MPEWLYIVLLTLGAGLAMPLGAVLALYENLQPRWLEEEFRHSVIAFGGGALVAAVALVLIPEGTRHLGPLAAALSLTGGALVFLFLDRALVRRGTPASQLVAMLSDFLPEALALGATLAGGSATALLLALLIALQNLPEGFNAYRELYAGGALRRWTIIALLLLAALLGPLLGLAGYFFLAEQPVVVGLVMVFAAGGILYLLFQDLAPQAQLENYWGPPLGAVAGFLLGMLGQMFTAG